MLLVCRSLNYCTGTNSLVIAPTSKMTQEEKELDFQTFRSLGGAAGVKQFQLAGSS